MTKRRLNALMSKINGVSRCVTAMVEFKLLTFEVMNQRLCNLCSSQNQLCTLAVETSTFLKRIVRVFKSYCRFF